jgi:tetratricopeptide (TPR) repeat protein
MLALADDAATRYRPGEETLGRVRAEVLATTALVFERPESRDLARADKLWQEAVAARGGWRARRAAFLARTGRLREALADVDAHVKSYGADAGALQARARVLRRLGWRELALVDLGAAVRLAPRDAGLHEDTARVQAQLGRTDAALAAWDRAVALAPRDTSLWSGRAELLARIGQQEEALRSLARAVELQPGDPRLQLAYADALWRARDPRAFPALRRYLDLTAERPELAPARAEAERRLASAPPDVAAPAALEP